MPTDFKGIVFLDFFHIFLLTLSGFFLLIWNFQLVWCLLAFLQFYTFSIQINFLTIFHKSVLAFCEPFSKFWKLMLFHRFTHLFNFFLGIPPAKQSFYCVFLYALTFPSFFDTITTNNRVLTESLMPRTYPFLSWCRGVASINPEDTSLSDSIRKRSFSTGQNHTHT